MATKLLKLADGVLLEIESLPNDVQLISSKQADRVQESLENIKPILIKACKPIISAWNELSQDMNIEQAEVELGLGFEGEGNIYITKAKANANLTVKLTLKPKTKLKIKNKTKR